ncbi:MULTISPECIES: hypothetical protein [unclassified Pseudomonas]|uniref:hypothetical protein n=1 Tax=Pseudomonas sp. BN411 TaxID=2567887 RepID=UPI002453D44E|nr:hypothetical protein [Pseudomonas sp. BN411]MDH4560645.1 hypothetical protein [Pseudomonas sp. BN411]
MSDLAEFEAGLTRLIGRPSRLRPFICDGSPLTCQVILVGANPATEMEEDFWSFWRPGIGFNKAAWMDAYLKERQTRPLKPGKTRRNPISNTRRVLEWVTLSAAPYRCLETNTYATATSTLGELALADRDSDPFEFLLNTIQPQLIVAHGRDAEACLKGLSLNAEVIYVDHFARGWSEVKARALGEQIRMICTSGDQRSRA